jgi:D-aspartate ligase
MSRGVPRVHHTVDDALALQTDLRPMAPRLPSKPGIVAMNPSRESAPAVLLAGEAIAMPVIRSLGRAGVEVHAVGNASWDPAAHSRYPASFVDLPARSADRWMDWLRDAAPRGAVILPCADPGVEFVARHRSELMELGFFPIEGSDEASLAMLDKQRTAELAGEMGVEAPAAVPVDDVGDLEAAVLRIGFPCALKPRNAALFQRYFGEGNKLVVARDEGELREAVARTTQLDLQMMVVEIIPGDDGRLVSYGGYLDERGDPITDCTFRKIRQFPPRYGLSSYAVSDSDREVAELGLRFVREAGLRGLFEVEFKRDPRDGRPKLIECNPRFTVLSLLFCGTDLALLAYARALGRPGPPGGTSRPGIHLWNPIEDTRAFLYYRRAGEWTLGSWLRSLLHRQHFHVLRWDDPMPTVRFHLRRLVRLARRMFGRTPRGGS